MWCCCFSRKIRPIDKIYNKKRMKIYVMKENKENLVEPTILLTEEDKIHIQNAANYYKEYYKHVIR